MTDIFCTFVTFTKNHTEVNHKKILNKFELYNKVLDISISFKLTNYA